MNEDTPNTEKDLSQRRKEKAELPRAAAHSSIQLQTVDKGHVHETESARRQPFIRWLRYARNTIYTYCRRFYNLRMRYRYPVKASCATSASRSRVDKAMAQEAEQLEATCRSTGIPVSTSCACSDWQNPVAGSATHPRGKDKRIPSATACTSKPTGRCPQGVGAKERKHESQASRTIDQTAI